MPTNNIKLNNIFPLVSIIVPCFNQGQYLPEAVESVLAQSYTNWECIIVNDGSTDQTEEVAKECCRRDKRIKYFYQQNGKQGKARNCGLEHSNGSYIAFLDADDLWLPEKLEKQLTHIYTNNVDLVFSDSYTFTDEFSNNDQPRMNIDPGIYAGDVGVNRFLQSNRIPILTVLVKKNAIIDVGGFTEEPLAQNAEDYHLWLKLLMNGYTFYSDAMPLAYYRIHSTSTSSDDRVATSQVLFILKDLFDTQLKFRENIKKGFLLRFSSLILYAKHPSWNIFKIWLNLFYFFTGLPSKFMFIRTVYILLPSFIFCRLFFLIYGKNFRNIPI